MCVYLHPNLYQAKHEFALLSLTLFQGQGGSFQPSFLACLSPLTQTVRNTAHTKCCSFIIFSNTVYINGDLRIVISHNGKRLQLEHSAMCSSFCL